MRTVAILSGKGGVGKTSLAVNLALALAEPGRRVLLADGDLALGTVDLFLGLAPHRDTSAYLDGDGSLSDTLAIGPRGVAVLPAAAGRGDLASLPAGTRARFLKDLTLLSYRFDWTVIDLPAGVGSGVLDLASAAEVRLVVTTLEPASILHAYAAIKLLAGRGRVPRVVANRIRTEPESAEIASRLARAASRHLGEAPEIWGSLPEDPAVSRAALSRNPFVITAPHAPASARVRDLARRLVAEERPAPSPLRADPFPAGVTLSAA